MTTPTNGAGTIAFVQLMKPDMHILLEDNRRASSTSDEYVLDPDPSDSGVYYGGTADIAAGDSKYFNDPDRYSDIPGTRLASIDNQALEAWGSGVNSHTRNEQFIVYLMFKPDSENSIWVTLRTLQWHWSGGATKNIQTGVWSLDAGATSSQNPGSIDSVTLPEWKSRVPIEWSLDQ